MDMPAGKAHTIHRVVDVLRIEVFGKTYLAVEPEIPEVGPGADHRMRIRISSACGAVLETIAVIEHRKTPPRKAMLLQLGGLLAQADVSIGSEIGFLDSAAT